MNAVVLEAVDLARHYEVRRGMFAGRATVKALAGASFTLARGRTLAVVGESGCGKSTLARLITLIEPPTAGTLAFDGTDVTGADGERLRKLRQMVQIVFQDPYGSLNPRKKVGSILEEPLVFYTGLVAAVRRASVDLQQPDSPTTASVSPAARVKLAPANALTVARPANMPRRTS